MNLKFKKKRIKKKYIPNGIYCYDNHKFCPFWKSESPNVNDLEKIYNNEMKDGSFYGDKDITKEQAISLMKNDKYFDEIYRCTFLKEIDTKESLLWDQCKCCGLNYNIKDFYPYKKSNKSRR